ncbi:unnamed protein product [Enterobius vermicularis]|uniref:Uncharacterized protein n=1 Tax=Enterobius vermicularis TaxID=51028 RepID=A0A0N4V6J7_ENTVE|nr:unnamed protein product [Enterobius vermicularis]
MFRQIIELAVLILLLAAVAQCRYTGLPKEDVDRFNYRVASAPFSGYFREFRDEIPYVAKRVPNPGDMMVRFG